MPLLEMWSSPNVEILMTKNFCLKTLNTGPNGRKWGYPMAVPHPGGRNSITLALRSMKASATCTKGLGRRIGVRVPSYTWNMLTSPRTPACRHVLNIWICSTSNLLVPSKSPATVHHKVHHDLYSNSSLTILLRAPSAKLVEYICIHVRYMSDTCQIGS